MGAKKHFKGSIFRSAKALILCLIPGMRRTALEYEEAYKTPSKVSALCFSSTPNWSIWSKALENSSLLQISRREQPLHFHLISNVKFVAHKVDRMELAQAHSRRLCLTRRSMLLLLPVSLVGSAQARPRPLANQEAGSESAFIKGLLEKSEASREKNNKERLASYNKRNFKVNTALSSVDAT